MDDNLYLRLLVAPEAAVQLSLREWNQLLPLARSTGTLGRFYPQLAQRRLLDRLPPEVLPHLESDHLAVERQQQIVRWEINQLQRALRELELPVVLLKGAAYIALGLRCACGRLLSDIDILVPEQELAAVEQRLLARGWEMTKTDPYDQRYYRRWMHELPPLRHRDRRTVVDVHHRWSPRTSRLSSPGEALLNAAVDLPGWPGVKTLQPVDMVLHSAVHGFWDNELSHPLRDLLDLHELLLEFSQTPTYWPQLRERAATLGVERPLYYALRYSARFLQTPVPTELLTALNRPTWLWQTTMDWALEVTTLPQRYSPLQRPLAAQLLYLRSHLLRMPLQLLLPHLLQKGLRTLTLGGKSSS